MDYELRDDKGRPRDVLMYRTPQELGSFGAAECPRPAKCLANAYWLWLVSTTFDGQPLSGMPKATATAVERGFRVVKTRKLDSLTLVLFEVLAEGGHGRHVREEGRRRPAQDPHRAERPSGAVPDTAVHGGNLR